MLLHFNFLAVFVFQSWYVSFVLRYALALVPLITNIWSCNQLKSFYRDCFCMPGQERVRAMLRLEEIGLVKGRDGTRWLHPQLLTSAHHLQLVGKQDVKFSFLNLRRQQLGALKPAKQSIGHKDEKGRKKERKKGGGNGKEGSNYHDPS